MQVLAPGLPEYFLSQALERYPLHEIGRTFIMNGGERTICRVGSAGDENEDQGNQDLCLEATLAEPFAYSQAWYERRGALLVEIVGEGGISGWGEAFGPPRLTAPAIDFYTPLLVGADALATDLLWQALYNRLRDHGQKGLAIEALSAVDIALWDLKGRHLGLPIHRLLGGPLRKQVQAYATGFYRKRHGNPLDYLLAEAEERVAAGFSGIKLKLGFGIDEDVRLCHAVRKKIGDGLGIMVDANHAYDSAAAIRLGRRIEEHISCLEAKYIRSKCRKLFMGCGKTPSWPGGAATGVETEQCVFGARPDASSPRPGDGAPGKSKGYSKSLI